MNWSMEQLLGAMKNEKVSTGVLGLLVMFAFYAYSWATDVHDTLASSNVSRSEYQKDQQELRTQIADMADVLNAHVKDIQIVNASQLIRDKELALQLAEAANATETQKSHLRQEIEDAKKYRECLIDQRPNCKHMKPPE
jgi:uncharacterized protein YaiL (DUF2058 family)